MNARDITISKHAQMQMRQRRITLDDVALILQYGNHVDGREEGTREACIELDGRPVTVVYDQIRFEMQGIFHIVTVVKRRCMK